MTPMPDDWRLSLPPSAGRWFDTTGDDPDAVTFAGVPSPGSAYPRCVMRELTGADADDADGPWVTGSLHVIHLRASFNSPHITCGTCHQPVTGYHQTNQHPPDATWPTRPWWARLPLLRRLWHPDNPHVTYSDHPTAYLKPCGHTTQPLNTCPTWAPDTPCTCTDPATTHATTRAPLTIPTPTRNP